MSSIGASVLLRVLAAAAVPTRDGATCADFLLALYDAHAFGGFDPARLSMLGRDLRHDIATIVADIAISPNARIPTHLAGELDRLGRQWRPQPDFAAPCPLSGDAPYYV